MVAAAVVLPGAEDIRGGTLVEGHIGGGLGRCSGGSGGFGGFGGGSSGGGSASGRW